MNKGFWEKLNKPIMALAPLYHVTDFAFREIIAKYGKPDVMFTEFTSVEGLMSEGHNNLLHLLEYSEIHRPIVAQIWGINPENFKKAAKFVRELGFDGIDINFGCPDKNVVKHFAGSGVIRKPELATEIIEATKEGAGELPVSVKTRIGYNKDVTEEWTEHLLKSEPVVLTMHGRTRKEMSKVPANWDAISKVVEVRDRMGVDTLILGNGDAESLEDAEQKVEKYGVDGVMMGRAIFGNPWRFNREVKKEDLDLEYILEVLLEQTILFEETVGKHRSFDLMKKHFASYIKGFADIKDFKMKLMDCKDSKDVESEISDFLKNR